MDRASSTGNTGISCNLDSVKRKGRKREKYSTTHEPLEFPSCRICGKRSTGIHFGVYSCEACKTFFRRSLLRRTPYQCDKGGKCQIQAEQQRGATCPACRLDKCRKFGMSKEGIRQGRYTVTERTNVILEVHKLRSQTCDENMRVNGFLDENLPNHEDQVYSVYTSSNCAFEEEEKSSEETESSDNQSSLSPESSSRSPFQNNNMNDRHSFTINDLSEEVERTSITHDTDSAQEYSIQWPDESRNILERVMVGYNLLEPFTKSLTDQEIQDILQEGLNKYLEKIRLFGKMEYIPTDQYNEIYEKTQIDVDGRKKLFTEGKDDIMKMANDFVKFAKNIPSFTELRLEDQEALLKASHFEFFTILDNRNIDLEKEMLITYTGKVMQLCEMCPYTPKETILRWGEFSKEVQKLKLSPEEHALVLGICVTFRDRCELGSPEEVENIQERLLDTLELTIQTSHHKDKGRRFAKIMDLFVRLRVIGDEYLELYKVICEDQCLKDTIPEFLIYL
ncbi:oxysterols receptor LXR-beta-like [Saccostrea echinata]|uniref:oxysterols receptor LXR-beta-like n=1 Tax=Saccostrea echinata TaxID=191078 RepID=UPI002A7FF310|nr:oxysterols receptor LXR-beta-like [Saccostrea echinata]